MKTNEVCNLKIPKKVENIGYAQEEGLYVFDRDNVVHYTDDIRVELPDKTEDSVVIGGNVPHVLIEKTNEEERCEIMREMLFLQPSITVPLFLFSVLAIVKDLFINCGVFPDGILYLFGMSGTLKTSFASLYIRDSTAKTKIFTSRKADLTKMAKKHKNQIILLDDLKKDRVKNTMDVMVDFIDTTARCVDNPDFPIAIVTGELLVGDYSLQDRMIQVRTDMKKTTILQKSLKN